MPSRKFGRKDSPTRGKLHTRKGLTRGRLALPRMARGELAERLQSARPGMAMLLLSGSALEVDENLVTLADGRPTATGVHLTPRIPTLPCTDASARISGHARASADLCVCGILSLRSPEPPETNASTVVRLILGALTPGGKPGSAPATQDSVQGSSGPRGPAA